MAMIVNGTKVNGDDENARAARERKRSLSMILESEDEREWIDCADRLPDPGDQVLIRFTNTSIVFAEDEENIIYAEDEKIARRLIEVNDDGYTWQIEPPFPKYDYSPLSSGCYINEGSVVTHWAKVTEDEIHAWKHRFDPIGDYTHLSIKVSSDYEELVYRALINGAGMIARSVQGDLNAPGNELQAAMYAALTDLQFCIDRDVHISKSNLITNHRAGVDMMPLAEDAYQKILSMVDGDILEASKLINALQVIDDNRFNAAHDFPDERVKERL